jgi:hypothetical protein
MHRDEADQLDSCAECGAQIRPNTDRGYSGSGGVVLCFDCAVARGGVFDADEDRWSAAPSVGDLAVPDAD